jgi:DNA repair protein RecN (Recombination protein N)
VRCDDLEGLANDFRNRLSALELGAEGIAAKAAEVKAAKAAFEFEAANLSAKRTAAAKVLDKAVQGELAPLKLERARFETIVEQASAGPDGIDRVTFSVATNPGAPAGPINKIASGGELSRFLLALKVCLTAKSSNLTMIFDEIDRGIGGATADAVGRRLADLAKGAQILVVTHSPQVAARGGHHILVAKNVGSKQTRTDVSVLSQSARTDEIARMLAGDVITDAARLAAVELLR